MSRLLNGTRVTSIVGNLIIISNMWKMMIKKETKNFPLLSTLDINRNHKTDEEICYKIYL